MPFSQKSSAFFAQAACLRVAGAGAPAFFHGQFTNDLNRGSGAVSYGLRLNQKGRVVADSFVLRLADKEFLLVSY